ncbi:CaaX farnesyltransferase beta subunit Ram1 [Westerdykella ornata]|uniref:Protein farnesyltransferase subunit beta n=1 Tax=Westerdykella ornata TaxID=318751 RepID=A0A6A6JJK6_WESOR|nr:CaaX farnesyltransferase beta subunit Ram1 [Westerdykella ornata]KAF2276677.1 CaaX farnesyltransferase beta subunit Ram1 [Westerdykella ornata]
MAAKSDDEVARTRLEELRLDSNRIQELSDEELYTSDSNADYEDLGPAIPSEADNIVYVNRMMPIFDDLQTETSRAQQQTLDKILPYLEGNPSNFPLNSFGIPKLQREKHVKFLIQGLGDKPAAYTTLDAARPWQVYWCLAGLTVLGHDISDYQQKIIDTLTDVQHPEGGYGGGFGHLPHLAPTYAAILSLAMAGSSAAYESINRRTLWHYLGRMKQADGGFTMAVGGEEDIRGAFCVLVALSLLNLPLDLPPDAPARAQGMTTFLDKLDEWISRCQTYEGGISASPGCEAHGAYTFCGLGCLAIMGPPRETMNKYLDMPALIRWLSYRQGAPEGGYAGRTNKLVDGCYSHWIGGCWPLVEAAVDKNLWNRSALGRYILSAAQDEKGGLRDKPGMRPDAYHTCYNLAGLSAAQHNYKFDEKMTGDVGKGSFGAPFHWKGDGLFEGDKVWDEEDVVEEVHPVFVIPFEAAMACREYFEAKDGF